MFEATLFYLFSALSVLCGLSVITRRNPIGSAISLVGSFFFLAALYAMLGAHFVAVIQILVYAGAIMVLFIFVIMLLNVKEERLKPSTLDARHAAGVAVGGLMGLGALAAIATTQGVTFPELGSDAGTVEAVGMALFSGKYLLPFEMVSILLTVGVVGAVVLAKKEL